MLLQSGSIVYAWDSLELVGEEAAGARDATGRLVTMERTVAGLQPDTAYVARIKVIENFPCLLYVIIFISISMIIFIILCQVNLCS